MDAAAKKVPDGWPASVLLDCSRSDGGVGSMHPILEAAIDCQIHVSLNMHTRWLWGLEFVDCYVRAVGRDVVVLENSSDGVQRAIRIDAVLAVWRLPEWQAT